MFKFTDKQQFNIFLDLPGPNSFSGTFRVLEILEIKIQDYPGGVGTLLK